MGRRKESVDIRTVGLENSKAVSGCKLGCNSALTHTDTLKPGRNSVEYLSIFLKISAIED
jgi:hypothetical protein